MLISIGMNLTNISTFKTMKIKRNYKNPIQVNERYRDSKKEKRSRR
jgi:hypothetical protein